MKSNNVIAQVLGGQKKILDGVATVSEVRGQLGLSTAYVANINGDAARDSDEVSDGDFVTFSEAVKGA